MFNSPLLQELEKRFKNKGDLPIFRGTVVKVMKLTEDRVSGAPAVTRIILRDQGLTAKILKVANSIYYNPTDKEINTISRAVVLLGFDMIRNISLGLTFVEMFQKHHPGIDLKKMLADSFIAATQGMEIANIVRHPEPEGVFISALLYDLGPITVAYYLPKEYLQSRQLMAASGIPPQEAERKVLGLPFHQVGVAFAKEWSLPDTVVEALSPPDIGSSPIRSPREQLRAIACLSNRITKNLFTPEESGDDLENLAQNLKDCLEIKQEEGVRLIENSFRKARDVSGLFGIEMDKFKPPGAQSDSVSPTLRDRILNRLEQIYEMPMSQRDTKDDENNPPSPPFNKGGMGGFSVENKEDQMKKGDEEKREERNMEPDKMAGSPRAILQLKFLQEISLHLFGNHDINILFNMILEGINRGIGFDRALLALCNPQKTRVTGRYSLGVDALHMANQLDLPIAPEDNIFGKSFTDLQPYFVHDAGSGEFRSLIPDTIRDAFKANAFVISPIHSRGNVIGFFYADKAVSGAPITREEYQSFLHFTIQANIGLERLMMDSRR